MKRVALLAERISAPPILMEKYISMLVKECRANVIKYTSIVRIVMICMVIRMIMKERLKNELT